MSTLCYRKSLKKLISYKYSLDEYEKKLEEWQDLIQKLFVKKEIAPSTVIGVSLVCPCFR